MTLDPLTIRLLSLTSRNSRNYHRYQIDYFKSTLHRVTIPPGAASDVVDGKPRAMTRARYSIPYFVSPDSAAIIECLSKCAGEENPPRYEPIAQDDYQRMRAKTQYK